MVALAAGAIVLVRFPFSDLSHTKLRPAVVLAGVVRDDWILCQITSNPYGDPLAIEIDEESFATGSLQRTSYVRIGKLFTANRSLIEQDVGVLHAEVTNRLIVAIVKLLQGREGKNVAEEGS